MAAASETAVALAPPGETYTAFTAELVATLQEGVPGAAELLDLNIIFRNLQRQLKAKSRPVPLALDRNGLGITPLIRNNAYVPAVPLEHDSHDMLQLLESAPRTATVAQLVSSVGMLHEKRSATATDIVRTALQVRAIAEIATLLSALYSAGQQAPAESSLPAMLLARPVKETVQLIDLLRMSSAEECVVSLLRLSAQLHPAHDAAAFVFELNAAGLSEHAQAVLTGFAVVREIEETDALIRLICDSKFGTALETVVSAVATQRPVTDVTELFHRLGFQELERAQEFLCLTAAQHRNAAETAVLISDFGQAGFTRIARLLVETGLAVRSPRYMAELVAALQSAGLLQEAEGCRALAVERLPVQETSDFIAHLLAVGQQRHALAATVTTAETRSVGEFGAIAAQLTSLKADGVVRELLYEAGRTCRPDEAAYLIARLDDVGNGDIAERVLWLSLTRPLGHAVSALQHLVQEGSRFLTDNGIRYLCSRQVYPRAIAGFAIALERVKPDKIDIILDIAYHPVEYVIALVDGLEKGTSSTLSNRVLATVVEKWGHEAQARLVIALEDSLLAGCADYLMSLAAQAKGFDEVLQAMRSKSDEKQPWWRSIRSNYEPSQCAHTKYVVQSAAETVRGIAKRYGVRDAGIIEGNDLEWPYDLHQGQHLTIPLQTGVVRFMVPRFPRKLRPGHSHPDVLVLQSLLQITGYLGEEVPVSTHYGPLTCEAVARFNSEHLISNGDHPHGKRTVTPHGWDVLHRIQRAQRVS
ncbi:PGRP and LysM peptidoglycan-binding domain-containing protein [Streptomyces sp. NBC_00151]|uniref:PGRP and LysM peptidoglycan-binding domain-containing protein n=1 Tax=Streptomyces sp. NBC_00151 TaxID=2975669 RepID=UPI002DD8675B|nr:LysM domain-containing protein [Streptomyces sp. NBC_00151]WRZ36952.1 LysM peptidoglycan-binding domain-containing protein [Streptomyces sp. NBC_00151]